MAFFSVKGNYFCVYDYYDHDKREFDMQLGRNDGVFLFVRRVNWELGI